MTTAAIASTALVATGRGESQELEPILRGMGFHVVPATGGEAEHLPDDIGLCLVDLRKRGDALKMARAVRARHPQAVVIGLADPARPAAAADAFRAGVFDVLPRPASRRDLEALVANAQEQTLLASSVELRPREEASLGIVSESPSMRVVVDLGRRAAAGRCGILICGERGTGRELVARAIHVHSGRHGLFVKVDCSAASGEELERKLLGATEGGRASGAPGTRGSERIGRDSQLREAAGGVLFLENVAEMPLPVQLRLVHALRDREVRVEDETKPMALDLRLVTSADDSLASAVQSGRLRADLYERLSLIRIDIPPFRERREDIPALATQFLKEACRTEGQPMKTLTRSALTLLSALPWRANAPELRGLLERLVLLVPNGLIRLEDVLAQTRLEASSISPTGPDATLHQARARFERDYIAAALQHHHGRIADAARMLGIQRTNLYRKIRQLNILQTRP